MLKKKHFTTVYTSDDRFSLLLLYILGRFLLSLLWVCDLSACPDSTPNNMCISSSHLCHYPTLNNFHSGPADRQPPPPSLPELTATDGVKGESDGKELESNH